MGAMGYSTVVDTVALIVLLINGVIFFGLQMSVVIKAKRLPYPPDYPPDNWDWFQKWVENKHFWLQLWIFLIVIMVLGYILAM